MSNKEEDFKIDPKKVDTGNGLLNIPLRKFINWLNVFDGNKDGRADLGQVVAIARIAMPVLIALLQLVDWDKLRGQLVNHSCVKNKAEFGKAFDKLTELAHEAAKISPVEPAADPGV